jgi:hypothetical protein
MSDLAREVALRRCPLPGSDMPPLHLDSTDWQGMHEGKDTCVRKASSQDHNIRCASIVSGSIYAPSQHDQ